MDPATSHWLVDGQASASKLAAAIAAGSFWTFQIEPPSVVPKTTAEFVLVNPVASHTVTEGQMRELPNVPGGRVCTVQINPPSVVLKAA
jgi:hypothetical protein